MRQAGARHCADVAGAFWLTREKDTAGAHSVAGERGVQSVRRKRRKQEPVSPAYHFRRRAFGSVELPVFRLSEIFHGSVDQRLAGR